MVDEPEDKSTFTIIDETIEEKQGQKKQKKEKEEEG